MKAWLDNAAVTDRRKQAQKQIAPQLEQLSQMRQLTQKSLDGNPLQLLAVRLYEDLASGRLDMPKLQKLIGALSDESLIHRIERLREFSAAHRFAENQKRCQAVFAEIARQYDNDFEGFSQQLAQNCTGIVLTAHPTFSQKPEVQQLVSELASDQTAAGTPLDPDDVTARLNKIWGQSHIPLTDINLAIEAEWSQKIITTVQQAMRQIYRWAFETARQNFPTQWKQFRPKLVTCASWVGYDTDGRTDIGWQVSFGNRLAASIAQLEHYAARMQEMLDTAADTLPEEARASLQQAHDIAQTEAHSRQQEYDRLFADDLKKFSQKITERTDRLKNARPLYELIERAAESAADDDTAMSLLLLACQMRNDGLATSHCHLRLNSVQLHNALWQILGLQGEIEEATTWRRYVGKINPLFEEVTPLSINFGVVNIEPMNAKRLMMIARLMLDYIDDDTPVRFLLAECESPFTILCALYLAHLFGIADKVAVSPLFETPVGIAKGGDTIAHLLDNPHYRGWVERRGEIPIEAGYSDAGRFSGQVTAALAIERLHIKLLHAIAERGIKADLLIFNTHGESVGRGGYPQNFRERLDYLLSPQVRRIAQKHDIRVIHETSFQGADGYALLGTPALVVAAAASALEHGLLPVAKKEDPFYRENDAALLFFQRIRRFNENLFNMPEYGDWLKTGHGALAYKTGSRQRKRQHESAYGVNPNHPSQIRAIPHNSLLQQMGWLANSIGGLGAAIVENKEWYWEMMLSSARMKQLMTLVWHARMHSSHNALYAYSALYDPDLWLRQAHLISPAASGDRKIREEVNTLCHIADVMSQDDSYPRLAKIVRLLGNDSIELNISLARTEKIFDTVTLPFEDIPLHNQLLVTHAVRLALKMQCYHLAVKIPRFAPFFEVSYEEVLRHIFDFDIPEALEMLNQIFPKENQLTDCADYGNNPTYFSANEGAMAGNYVHLHRQIFEPLAQIYDLLRQTGGVISNFLSAHG